MKKVVFDTNVWVSAFGFPGRVRSLLNPDHHGKFYAAVSPAILGETTRTLGGPKFGLPSGVLAAVEHEIRKLARVVHPNEHLEVVKADPDDNRILECAVEAGAEIIVSGDRHLLEMGVFRGIRIMTPAAFLAELEREKAPGKDSSAKAGGENPPTAHESPAGYHAAPAKAKRIKIKTVRKKVRA